MRILSRYLVGRFLAYVGLGILAFFGLVLATRFHEVARFAALGAPLDQIGILMALQFPYIFPFVLPVSMGLAGFMLMRQLSLRFELMSLRAGGFSIYQIQKSLWVTACVCSCFNFWLVSDVATWCHQKARLLEREFREINPLVFLKRPELLGLKGLEVISLGQVDPGRLATKSIIAMPDIKKGRLSILMADSLVREGLDVVGHDVLFLSSFPGHGNIPDIVIDQSEEMRLYGESFFRYIRKDGSKISTDFLTTPLLLWRIKENSSNLRAISELLRRLSVALEPFTLALAGLSLGIFVGRGRSLTPVLALGGLVLLNLIFLFLGKSFDKNFMVSLFMYLLPHPLLWFYSYRRLHQISIGYV